MVYIMAYQLNLNWPEFLEKYWQKQPVVLKNAFPNFVDPITPDELAGLAMEPEVDSRLVSHKNGQWQAANGPFEDFTGICRRRSWYVRFACYRTGVWTI